MEALEALLGLAILISPIAGLIWLIFWLKKREKRKWDQLPETTKRVRLEARERGNAWGWNLVAFMLLATGIGWEIAGKDLGQGLSGKARLVFIGLGLVLLWLNPHKEKGNVKPGQLKEESKRLFKLNGGNHKDTDSTNKA